MCADDRLLSVTDPLLRQTVYGYDAMSRRISVSNPAIQASPLLQQSYTPDGLIASLTDANNNTTSFTPDGFDRLSTTSYPDGSTENLTYDSDSNVLTRQTRAGPTIAFTYDTLNRLSAKAPPSEPTVSYAYDLASHLIGIGDNSSAIARPAASASYATALAYDQLNRPLAVSWRPAPAQAAPTAATASFAFGYDATNRRIGQSATDKSWWSFPAAAANVGYSANNLNQYSAVGAVTPSYDGNGNLTSDGTFTYRYDAENRLISASGTGLAASYTYDAQGRRKSKTVNGTTTIYVTDVDNREVLEYNGSSGAIGNWYSFAPANAFGPDAVLNQMNVAAATRATLIPDSQGSIVGALDASSGTLTKTGYEAYGENPSLTTGSFQYTARRFDPETAGSTAQPSGLYYYRSRMYSPAWGRFLQVDPIGYAAGSNLYPASGNLYAYVNNDPLNSVDPSGLDTWSLGFNLNGFFGGGYSITAGIYYNTDTGRFGTFETTGQGGGLDISANIALQDTFGGPGNFFGAQFGSAFTGARGPLGGGPTYGPNFNPTQLSSYANPSGFQISIGASGIQELTGLPFAMSVEQSTTYETTGAVTAALAAENGDLITASEIGPAAPIPGVSNEFILGPNDTAANQASTNSGNTGQSTPAK